MNTPAFEWEKEIRETLLMTDYCCLSTGLEGGSWANPVYFSFDDDVNLYFISQPHSLHMRNIRRNPAISVAIYSTAQKTSDPVRGVQIKGRASVIESPDEAIVAYDRYFGRVNPEQRKNIGGAGVGGTSPQDYVGDLAEWEFGKVVPEEIWYFDNRYFGEERMRTPPGLRIRGV